MRTDSVLLPQSISVMAWMMFLRALSLSDGATESSRSRLMTSAELAAIFSKMAGRDPGPNSWQRFGRATGVGWIRNDMRTPVRNEIANCVVNWLLNYAAACKVFLRLQSALCDAASPA